MARLEGKVALVTGGSRGIGAAIARRLAAEGAAIVITYTRAAEAAGKLVAELRAEGGGAYAVQADNQDEGAMTAAIREAGKTFGRLDILVNNAGIFDAKPLSELTGPDFDRMIDINLRGPFIATREAAALLPDGGRIISIGSNLAERLPWEGLSLYAMSKAGLIGFTRALARELGGRGITVNLVQPGSTDTDMNPAGGELAELQRKGTVLGRFNRPEEVAGLVAWLAGPEAGNVTGSLFTIDAGANV